MSVRVSFNRSSTWASIVFAHPTGNILTAEIVSALRATLADLAEERRLRLVTIEGDGQNFSFGASIPEHTAEEIARVLPDMHALIVDLLELPAPTAAIVRGRCLGGGFELTLACDAVFAADDAMFGLPEIALGVFPPAGTVLLPRRVGYARATAAILTGDARSAEDWRAMGLVEAVAPAERLSAVVGEWFGRTLERHSAEALRHTTRALRAPLVDAARAELPAVEKLYLTELMRTHDANEGVRAFLEKRAPLWRDE
jgi:cyclohexa-1,5-dienecarbonyl-CoA hydratase